MRLARAEEIEVRAVKNENTLHSVFAGQPLMPLLTAELPNGTRSICAAEAQRKRRQVQGGLARCVIEAKVLWPPETSLRLQLLALLPGGIHVLYPHSHPHFAVQKASSEPCRVLCPVCLA